MSLAPGTRLGPYEVIAPIGAGGMGEVWRVRDTKLGRDVALKILPDAFAEDPDRLARFQREAHVLASLNHPNIAHIYGLEDEGRVTALVMELVEGPTLADRVRQGPIPVDDALSIAKQIVDALEAAHEQGIVHRDLKPANVKLKDGGMVKVLDFGLAKAMEPAAAPGDIANSPTITSPTMTQQGVILGTAAYMSPEQAMGKAVDRRADIWAFGVVLYEMLTGQRAFEGKQVAEVLASVIKAEPDWSKLPVSAAPGVRALLTRCLEKDPKHRWRDIADVQFVLDAAAAERIDQHSDRPAARALRIPLVAKVAGGAVLLVLVAIAVGQRLRLSSPDGVPPLEFIIDHGVATVNFAVSPDGRQLAFAAESAETGRNTLWVRSFSSVMPRQIPGTEGSVSVFWSPDSRSMAFFAGGALNAVDVSTGSLKRLCGVTGNNWGGSWSRENIILFSSDDGTLKQVPAVGGTPVPASRLGAHEDGHRWPFFLPDGVHFLYVAVAGDGLQNSQLRVGSLNSTDTIALGPARTAAMYSAGYLLYVPGEDSTTLVAQPFDVSARRSYGTAIPVANGIFTIGARGAFSVSDSGALAYGQRNSFASTTRLTWIDRRGQVLGTVGEPGVHTTMRLSPDGKRLAFSAVSASSPNNFDLWILDFTSGRTSKLTNDPGYEFDPVWSPDGSHIVFNSNRNGPFELFRTPSNGGGREERLLRSDRSVRQPSWSHDGRWLVYSENAAVATSPSDLWVILAAGGTPRKFVESPFNEANAAFSPDDRWVAYQSNASGRPEVYVRPFPDGNGEFKVSQHGGRAPAWRGDGQELFFVAPDGRLLTASIDTTQGFHARAPQPLFSARLWGSGSYVASKDGSRFLVAVEEPTREETAITVTTNWLPKISRRAN